ncbi:MAG TPA: pentapeptide repeat-containing protein, partial [Thermoanaerobaculia bacterium]
AIGLLRIYRRALRRSEGREGQHCLQADLAFKCTIKQIQSLDRWRGEGHLECEPLVRRIARSVTITNSRELDGHLRGQLVKFLFDGAWLKCERNLALKGANFRGVELAQAQLEGINLAGADLSGADLSGARLTNARLRGCSLGGADLRSGVLSGADLARADLRYARLQNANLQGADLSETLLDGANFWGGDLTGVDLTDSQGIAEYMEPVSVGDQTERG